MKIQENSQITLEQLKEKISRTYQLTVSIESIRKAIHRLKVTLKVASQTLEIVNSVVAKENGKIYAQNFLEEDANDERIFVFIDESGFNPHLRRTMARSARGAPASIILPSVRGINISLITAISREEVLFSKPISGPVDATKYRDFFMGLIAKCVEKNIITRCTFILDNARIHNAMMMREFYTGK